MESRILTVSLLLIAALALPMFGLPTVAAEYSDIIGIDGDSDFTTQANDNNWSGSGTEADPYILADLQINVTSSSTAGIEVRNTDHHFIIENCSIDGNDTTWYNQGGIILYGAPNGIIDGCTLYGLSAPIEVRNSGGAVVRDSVIQGVGSTRAGIKIYSSEGTEVSNNTIELLDSDADSGCCRDGIVVDGSDDSSIRNNSIENTTRNGLLLDGSVDLTVDNNTLMNTSFGFDFFFSSDTPNSYTFTANTVNGLPVVYLASQTGGDSIDLTGVGQLILVSCSQMTIANQNMSGAGTPLILASSNMVISNNSFSNMFGPGMKLLDDQFSSVENNSFTGNRGNGLEIEDSGHTSITNNYMASNENAGLDIYRADDLEVRGNLIEDNEGDGLNLFAGDTNTFIRNTIIDNADSGVSIFSEDHHTFESNLISGNNWRGIDMWQVDATEFLNNTITLNGYHGIEAKDTIDLVVRGNLISDNGWSGVFIDTFSDSDTVTGVDVSLNMISDNTAEGLEIENMEDSVIIENIFRSNDAGYKMVGSSNNLIWGNDFSGESTFGSVTDGSNVWNETYPQGGNHWGTLALDDLASGEDQDQTGSDGIYDSHKYISSGNYDRYPLVQPPTIVVPALTGDIDDDGVPDVDDLCPGTEPGSAVDDDGCADDQLDDDDDGVTNGDDLCPDTPATDMVDDDGCGPSQLDSDADGVMDDVDQCPNTPMNDTADATGCGDSQVDDDGDGVFNADDLCPDTPVTETADDDGCSPSQLDSDGDGVMDDVDQCPNTSASETVDQNGCAANQLDSDGDSIHDGDDACPGTPSGTPVDSTGCPEDEVIHIWPDDVGGYDSAQNYSRNISTGHSSLTTLYEVDNLVANVTYLIEWHIANGSDSAASVIASGNLTIDAANNTGFAEPLHAAQNLSAGCYAVSAELFGGAGQSLDDDEYALCISGAPAVSDADGDGIHDGDDTCPDTPAGVPVDSTGCPEESGSSGAGDGNETGANQTTPPTDGGGSPPVPMPPEQEDESGSSIGIPHAGVIATFVSLLGAALIRRRK